MSSKNARRSLMTIVLALVMVLGGIVAVPEKVSAANSKTLSINWDNIKKVGKQTAYSVSCGCFAAAYSKTIVDNKVHYWYEFDSVGKKDQFNCSSNWKGCTSKEASSVNEIYKIAYDSINNNKPVIVRVQGNLSSGHYVTIVGYKNVESRDKLSASNFIMIDSVSNKYQTYTLNTNYGWNGSSYNFGYKVISKANGKYQYVIPNGSVNVGDTTAPKISNWKVTSVTSEGATIECDITDNIKVTKSQITVWKATEKSETAKFYNPVSVNGNHYTFKWSISDFNNYRGQYKTNIHAWDAAGNKTMQSYATNGYLLYTIPQPTVTNNKPIGNIDGVVCDTPGKIHIAGWAFDKVQLIFMYMLEGQLRPMCHVH